MLAVHRPQDKVCIQWAAVMRSNTYQVEPLDVMFGCDRNEAWTAILTYPEKSTNITPSLLVYPGATTEQARRLYFDCAVRFRFGPSTPAQPNPTQRH